MGYDQDGNWYSQYSGEQIDFLLTKNRNWIRNGYFVGGGTAGKFPINQRGSTSYTSVGGSIDGWDLSSGSSLSISSDYITIPYASGGNGVTQVIENGQLLAGKKVTLSAVCDNGYVSIYADGVFVGSIEAGGAGQIRKRFTSATFDIPSGTTTLSVKIAYGLLWAVKLEEGTACTLTTDLTAPNYGEELAWCQRYLAPIKTSDLIHGISISGTYYFDIPTHQQMASAPVLTDLLDLVLVANGGTERVTIPAGTSGTVEGAGVGFSATVGSIGNLQTAVAQVQQNTFLSCE